MNLINCIAKNKNKEEKGIFVIDIDRNENFISYKKLYDKSLILLHKLQLKNLKKDDKVILQMNGIEEYLYGFWACILGGMIPVPIPVIKRSEDISKLFKIMEVLHNTHILTNYNLFDILNDSVCEDGIKDNYNLNEIIIDYNKLSDEPIVGTIAEKEENEIAIIQFSSGTTGIPKGVMCTNKGLITNIGDIISSYEITNEKSMGTWMPITHNSGLILFHMAPMFSSCNQYLMEPLTFTQDPTIWLDVIHKYKVNITFSPNFGFQVLLDNLTEDKLKEWDLSSIDVIVNAAEPISNELCIRFIDILKKYGIKNDVIYPCYGLTEACLLVSCSSKVKAITVDRNKIGIGKVIKEVSYDDKDGNTFVAVGSAVGNFNIRICDSLNNSLNEKTIGKVQIKGISNTPGYYNKPELTKELITEDGWMNTGDIGFLYDNQLVVIGRTKDIIFINGQNFYSQDLENIMSKALKSEQVRCIACGIHNDKQETEECIIFVNGITSSNEFSSVKKIVLKEISRKLGIGIRLIIPVNNIPTTSSGKVQRFKMVQNYIEGVYDKLIEEFSPKINEDNHNTIIVTSKNYELLRTLWGKNLGLKDFNSEDNFFELGGNSFKIMNVFGELNKLFDITIYELYKYQSFGELVNKLESYETPKITKSEENATIYSNNSEDIAVVGISCKLPKVNNINEYWKLLTSGECAISEIPDSRWDWREYYGDSSNDINKTKVKYGGFINGIEEFDPLFFGISPIEATYMDPQQRLLLMHTWKALEDSGINPLDIKGSNTGVFFAIMDDEYSEILKKYDVPLEGFSPIGKLPSVAPNRISYFFDIHGPSEAIETACSSSLVAINRAISAIKDGSCNMAIVGGANLILTPEYHICFDKAGMLSQEGRCNTFSDQANGYVRGEGIGVIILKKLSQAIKDKDDVYGVIKGTAVNHGGRANTFTTPSPKAQEEVIKKALDNSKINKSTISYIEAHGTGTKIGDVIEVNALSTVFEDCKSEMKCALGSVKQNIGHLEIAAGMASLIKVLLQIKNKTILKNININNINPYIGLEKTPFYVSKENEIWEPCDNKGNPMPRRAGISSFGFGGSNSHIILEEYVDNNNRINNEEVQQKVLLLSGVTKDSLKVSANELLSYLDENEVNNSDLSNILYTLQVGRESFNHRVAITIKSIKDLKDKLSSFIQTDKEDNEIRYAYSKDINRGIIHFEDKDINNCEIQGYIDLWLSGNKVMWNELYTSSKVKKVHLPTYPFGQKKYWPENKCNIQINNEIDKNEHILSFEKQLNNSHKYENNFKNVVIFFNEESQTFIDEMEEYISGNWKVGKLNKIDLSMNLNDIEEEIAKDEFIDAFIYLGSRKDDLINLNSSNWNESKEERILFNILKIINKNKINCNRRHFYFIQQDNYRIDDNMVNPFGGGVTGISYALLQSDKSFIVNNIDLSIEDMNNFNNNKLFELIFTSKWLSDGSIYKILNNEIYKLELQTIAENYSDSTTVNNLKEKGTYVIIGGSGTVGKYISRKLIDEYNANIIWIGRSEEKSFKVEAALKEFDDIKSKPNYIQGDITDLSSMHEALAKIKNSNNKINGVIFSALDFEFSNSIYGIEETEFFRIVNVKTVGGYNCYKLFMNEDLDFMCYFSSIQAFSFVEARYSSPYACGITACDTLVRYLNSISKFPIGTINWGYFQESSNKINTDNIAYITAEEAYGFLKKYINIYLPNGITEMAYFNSKLIKNNIKIKDNNINENNTDYLISQIVNHKLNSLNVFNNGKCRIIPKYKRWLNDIKEILQNNDVYLEGRFDSERVNNQWQKEKQLLLLEADTKGRTELLSLCLDNLNEILSGSKLATDVIFPEGSMKLVESVYQKTKQAELYNDIVAKIIKDIIKDNINNNKKIKILEIGAGTGGTSTKVLDEIEEYKDYIEYFYTDISRSFLIYGEDKFSKYKDFMQYELLNVENNIEEQKFTENSFQIIFASNVIHATKDIKKSLENINKLLVKGGALILNEIVEKELFSLLTFGLLDGWWLYEDPEIRIKGSPLLSKKGWMKVLDESGFINKELLYKTNSNNQDILLAIKNNLLNNSNNDQNKIVISTDLVDKITEILSNCLRISKGEIDEITPFKEYGLDSILGIKFINKINEELGINLNTVIIFDYSTIELLAKYIENNFNISVTKNKDIAHIDELEDMFMKGDISTDSLIEILAKGDEYGF